MAFNNHCYLFKGRISRTFTDTVDGNLYLAGTIQNTCHRVGSSHSQIIMTVGRNDCILNTCYMIYQIFDFRAILGRQAVTCCIRNIHYCSTSLNNRFNHTSQIFIIRTSCILCIKLYIIHKTTGIFHCRHSTFDNLFPIRIEFIFNM